MEKIRPHVQATTSKLLGRVPKQVQRCLPVYGICVLFLLFLSNANFFGSSLQVAKRVHASQLKATKALRGDQFPRKIWQTWKVDALSFDERDNTCARTWTAKNPGFRYEVLTDNNDMYYVETHFGPAGIDRPDIVEMYRALTARIIKADLLRYLVMYVEGGVYTDIDVEALKPVDRFIPNRYAEAEVDMIVGVEIDQPDFADHPILGSKSMSFCQWTFMCKPGLPLMMHLIDNILHWLNDVAQKQGKPISDIVLDFDEVIAGTGPSAFTGAVLAEMSETTGRAVEWSEFHAMSESKLVGGVLVLTVEAFAAGQGHSDSGNHNSKNALVKHRYHASGWPSAHPRYKHPVYGEVERCNWEPECVKLWDVNKAAFENLSAEEKAKMIAIKEVGDAQQAAQQAAQAALLPLQHIPQIA